MPNYIRLSKVTVADSLLVGGKAARLGEAMALGCPVPKGVVLTTELYRRHMQQGGLQGEIASILATMQPATMTQFLAVEWAVQSAFRVRRMPDEIVRAIEEAWGLLSGVPMAVRSSATREDSPEQSFVGQHETIRDVASRDALVEAVETCWMSLYSAKALSYAQRFGVDLLQTSMAVLLQPMVSYGERGALFTVDPISGDPDQFVLEVQRGAQPGVHRLDPYTAKVDEPALWGQLRDIGLTLDERSEAYQAIQWVVDDSGHLALMRVRPVTGVPPFLPVSRSDQLGGVVPLSLVAPEGVTARATKPFSRYHQSRSGTAGAAFLLRANRLLSLDVRRVERYVRGYLYERWEMFSGRVPSPNRLLQSAQLLSRLGLARRLLLNCDRFWPSAAAKLAAFEERAPRHLDRQALSRRHQRVIALHTACLEHLGAFGDLEGYLEQALRRATGRTDFGVGARDVASTSENSRSALGQLWGSGSDCDPFAWGDMMAEPSLTGSGPEGNVVAATDPAVSGSALSGVGSRFWRTVGDRGERVRAAKRRLRQAVGRCARFEREVLQEVGRRLVRDGLAEEAGDACLLGCDEIDDWLEGRLEATRAERLLIRRREDHRRWARYCPPAILDAEMLVDGAQDGDGEVAGRKLNGLAISPGVGRGRARVVQGLSQLSSLLPGEVLVCDRTLFEYSPLFSMVSAVVAETGSLLDHAGVLAREYGVPAVFCVEDATQEIRSGDPLVVDAARGLVTVVEGDADWTGDWDEGPL